MKRITQLGPAALLRAAMPLAFAQRAAQEAPPVAISTGAPPAQAAPPAPAPPANSAKPDAEQAVDVIRGYSTELREQAVANARQAADDLDNQMARLQQEMDRGWARMSQTARTRSQSTMSDLRKRRNELGEWYGGMQHGSAAAWVEVRTGFVNTYRELADAMVRARTELDQAQKPAEKPAAHHPPSDKNG